MEIDAVRPRYAPLSPEERKIRMDNKLCLYCGKPCRVAADCRTRSTKSSNQGKLNATVSNESKNMKPQA